VSNPLSSTQTDVPLFFNRKVVKPVKGGGKGAPTVNPYGSKMGATVAIKPQSTPISFNDFISSKKGTDKNTTMPTNKNKNKVVPAPA